MKTNIHLISSSFDWATKTKIHGRCIFSKIIYQGQTVLVMKILYASGITTLLNKLILINRYKTTVKSCCLGGITSPSEKDTDCHIIFRENTFFLLKNLNFYLANFIFQNKLNPKADTFENFVRHTAALHQNPSKTIRI